SADAMQARLIGIAIAVAPGRAGYIPLNHGSGEGALALGGAMSAQLSEKDTLLRLKPMLEDEGILKLGHDLKFASVPFAQRGIALKSLDDAMLLSYVLDVGLHVHELHELSEVHLNHKPVAMADILGKGRDKIPFEQVAVAQATRCAAERADVGLRLSLLLKPRLVAERRMTVYETLERPLVTVLAQMERNGIVIAPAFLAKLSNDFAQGMAKLQQDACRLAGE